LQGTVSGVNVTSTSGAPGAKLDIRIRVLLQTEKTDQQHYRWVCWRIRFVKSKWHWNYYRFKDAQAAIYGTIGANGVILITTKQVKKFKAKISQFLHRFSGNNKVAWLLNATEYALLLNESYANGGNSVPFSNVSGLGKGTNWQKRF
jgi:TonB-dependent SusC/RagA subfamily outer membrane receptor